MVIDKLVLVNGEVFERYRENDYVPKKEGFIAIYRPEDDPYTRYINVSHILYAGMKNGKIEKAYDSCNAQYAELINRFTETRGGEH